MAKSEISVCTSKGFVWSERTMMSSIQIVFFNSSNARWHSLDHCLVWFFLSKVSQGCHFSRIALDEAAVVIHQSEEGSEFGYFVGRFLLDDGLHLRVLLY